MLLSFPSHTHTYTTNCLLGPNCLCYLVWEMKRVGDIASLLVLLIDCLGFYIIQKYEGSIFCSMHYMLEHRSLMGPNKQKYVQIWLYKYPKMVQDCVYSATDSWHRNNALLFCIFNCQHFIHVHCIMYLPIAGSWGIRVLYTWTQDVCLCHLELGVPQQLKLLQGLGMIHRPNIVHEP